MDFSDSITNEANVADLIYTMQGPDYCLSGMDVPDECAAAMEEVLPPIMMVLSAALMDDPPTVCNNVLGENTC